jgi:hypothetical protein
MYCTLETTLWRYSKLQCIELVQLQQPALSIELLLTALGTYSEVLSAVACL